MMETHESQETKEFLPPNLTIEIANTLSKLGGRMDANYKRIRSQDVLLCSENCQDPEDIAIDILRMIREYDQTLDEYQKIFTVNRIPEFTFLYTQKNTLNYHELSGQLETISGAILARYPYLDGDSDVNCLTLTQNVLPEDVKRLIYELYKKGWLRKIPRPEALSCLFLFTDGNPHRKPNTFALLTENKIDILGRENVGAGKAKTIDLYPIEPPKETTPANNTLKPHRDKNL